MTHTINHHLTDQLLMAYSAGNLPEAFNLVVATHISMCDECRARLESFDALGGAVLAQAESVAMTDGALEATLRMIDAPVETQIRADVAPDALFPTPLRDYVGGDLDAVSWRSVAGGVQQAILPTTKDATVRLLRIPGGVAMPDHGHQGMELTLVLQGAYRDDHDRFGPGDVEIATEDLTHTPIAEAGEDCICLAATDARLKFSGLLPRLAQPFFRI